MDHERHRRQTLPYEPESWRDDNGSLEPEVFAKRQRSHPDVRDQCRVLELLGRINYRIIKGDKVYIETGGEVYKTLYGGYWRSVFTGIEHYLLKCEEVSGSAWTEGSAETAVLDLPIVYSKDGWTARGNSLSFLLSRDSTALKSRPGVGARLTLLREQLRSALLRRELNYRRRRRS